MRSRREPGDRLAQREQLDALSAAIGELTERQREVFVAIALNEVSIDVLAIQLRLQPQRDLQEPVRCATQAARQPRRGRAPVIEEDAIPR